MNYLLKSKPKYNHLGKIISVVVLFCLLSLLAFFFLDTTRDVSYRVVKPLLSLSSTIIQPFSKLKGFFIFKNSLITKNLALEEELLNLRLKEIDYNILSKEYEDLKSQMGRTGSASRVVSRVLSKPPYSPYDTFVIFKFFRENIIIYFFQ